LQWNVALTTLYCKACHVFIFIIFHFVAKLFNLQPDLLYQWRYYSTSACYSQISTRKFRILEFFAIWSYATRVAIFSLLIILSNFVISILYFLYYHVTRTLCHFSEFNYFSRLKLTVITVYFIVIFLIFADFLAVATSYADFALKWPSFYHIRSLVAFQKFAGLP